jgi:cytoskeletal protein RodZ
MAEDIQEDGSEEKKNQKVGSQDDDDFGLPDLEFEELEELDLDSDDEKEESGLDVIDEVEIDDSSMNDKKDEPDLEDENLSIDLSVDPDQEASRVLEGEEEEEDNGIDFSSSDQSAINLSEENTESIFASDPDAASDSEGDSLFGDSENFSGGSIFESDEIELKEEDKQEFQSADEAELPSGYKPYSDENEKGGFAKIIIFGAIGITLIGLAFLFAPRPEGDDSAPDKETKTVAETEKPKAKSTQKQAPKEESEKVATPKADSKKKTIDTAKKVAKKSTPAPKVVKKVSKPASSAPAGEIINVQAKTGRSYIVIGSFIDQDIANDFAKELSGKGKGAKVIFPYGKSKRYRVSIADFDSYSDAAAQINSYKSTYGDGAWALKY